MTTLIDTPSGQPRLVWVSVNSPCCCVCRESLYFCDTCNHHHGLSWGVHSPVSLFRPREEASEHLVIGTWESASFGCAFGWMMGLALFVPPATELGAQSRHPRPCSVKNSVNFRTHTQISTTTHKTQAQPHNNNNTNNTHTLTLPLSH